ncbi:MAG TPA: hypothetical protein VFE33_07560, partial [Thermoanaerobaculia bacterium]|nr:hypothetical protein [Thermoanaerobaculia bacterium]
STLCSPVISGMQPVTDTLRADHRRHAADHPRHDAEHRLQPSARPPAAFLHPIGATQLVAGAEEAAGDHGAGEPPRLAQPGQVLSEG